MGDAITDALQRCFVSRDLIGRNESCAIQYRGALKTCLNPPRGRGEKRIGTLASQDDIPPPTQTLFAGGIIT